MVVSEEELNGNLRILTVDGLKNIIRTLNQHLKLKLRVSGNKSDFIDRIEDTLDHYKHNNTTNYEMTNDIVMQIFNTGSYSRPASGSGPRIPPSGANPATRQGVHQPHVPPKSLTWKPNPFQSIIKQISEVAVLNEAKDRTLRSVLLEFKIPPDFSQQLYQSRIVPSNPVRHQLRIYAASSDFYKPHLFDQQLPIDFPVLCDLKINGHQLKTNTRGVRNQPGTAAPPNADCDKGLRISPDASNTLEVVYRDTNKKHYIVINLVEQYSCDQMVNMVKQQPQIPASDVIEKYRSMQDNDDVVAGASTVSLKCPIGFFRMNTPVRSASSQSLQCFDAMSFFSINEQLPTFTDPSSKKPIKFKDLAVDQYTYDILQAIPEDYGSVVVEPDAEWHTEDGKYGSELWMEANKAAMFPEHDSEDTKEASEKPVKKDRKEKSAEILHLSSDDEDADGSSFTKQPPRSTVRQKQSQVIDLTLSSDEEDESANVSSANTSYAPPLGPQDSVQKVPLPFTLKRNRESEEHSPNESEKRRLVESVSVSGAGNEVTSNGSSNLQSPAVAEISPDAPQVSLNETPGNQQERTSSVQQDRLHSDAQEGPQNSLPDSPPSNSQVRPYSEPQSTSLPPLILPHLGPPAAPAQQSSPQPNFTTMTRPAINYQPPQQYRPYQVTGQPQVAYQPKDLHQPMHQPRFGDLQPISTTHPAPSPQPLPRPTYAKPTNPTYRPPSQRNNNGCANNYKTW